MFEVRLKAADSSVSLLCIGLLVLDGKYFMQLSFRFTP